MNCLQHPVLIRPCQGFEELSACVQLQVDVWGYGDRDVVPRRVFIVSQKIGGQVIGRVRWRQALVGFAMALPGISEGRPYLHSHMLAVNPDYRNQGIGRRLKLFQRDEALARGINRMEWTFDPLEIKNSFLNLAKLGAIVRRYAANFYGVSSSRLHGQVPTDRLYAEWWLDSDWVCSALGGKPVAVPAVEQEIVSTASNCSLEALACRIRNVFLTSKPGIASNLNRRLRASWRWLALGSMQRAMEFSNSGDGRSLSDSSHSLQPVSGRCS